MKKEILSALIVACILISGINPITAQEPKIILSEDSNIQITGISVKAANHHEIWLSSPATQKLFDDSHDAVGRSKTVGPYSGGSEVKLYIENGGRHYSDYSKDCIILKIDGKTYLLKFEDATDYDYNDVIVRVDLLPTPGIPGFEVLFAIAGLLAVAYLLKRRR